MPADNNVFELPWLSLADRPTSAAHWLGELGIENCAPQWPTAVVVGTLFANDDHHRSRWLAAMEASGLAAFYRRHSALPMAWALQRHASRVDGLDHVDTNLQAVLGQYNAGVDLALQKLPELQRQYGHVVRTEDGKSRICLESADDAIFEDIETRQLRTLDDAASGSAFTLYVARGALDGHRLFIPALQRSLVSGEELDERNRRVAAHMKNLSDLDGPRN